MWETRQTLKVQVAQGFKQHTANLQWNGFFDRLSQAIKEVDILMKQFRLAKH